MKSFNEILESLNYDTESFETVNRLAEKEADKYAAKIYGEEAEKLMKSTPEIIDWCFISSSGIEVKGLENLRAWSRKNDSKTFYSSAQGSGICFTVKMKFPITKSFSFKTIVGDSPVYIFKVHLIFNTTGNKARTFIYDMEGIFMRSISDTTSMSILVGKLKRLDHSDRELMHKRFYKDWVLSLDNHPLKASYSGEKFGL